ncbi:hypothetical protein Hanom_Chr03g00239791 [Helianthus anomalus]
MAQPPAGVGPEKKKRVSAVTAAPKKVDSLNEQSSKAKNVREEKKGVRPFLKPRCDYVVVSDTLEGLASVVVKKPKPEPEDTTDIPASNPDEPIDLDSSPEPLVRTKVVNGSTLKLKLRRSPAKKVPRRKIGKKGNRDAFVAKFS